MATRGEILKKVRHEIDMLELKFSRIAYEFAQTDEYELEGSVTPTDWISTTAT